MTGTITVTKDIPNQRMGVTLAGWVSPANGPVQVFRVHPDTTEWPVRGSLSGGGWQTSGGSAFAWDYEMPFLQSVTYYATDGTTTVRSLAKNLGIRSSWLTAPGLPASDSKLLLRVVPRAVARDRPSVVIRPLGRSTSVPLTDVMKARQFSVSALTMSYAESSILEATLEMSGTLLLQMPLARWPWQYVTVSKVVESPTNEKFPFDGTTVNDATGATWDFTCETVAYPTGGVYGDPTASYQAILDTYATYAALKAAKATYLDVLKGV